MSVTVSPGYYAVDAVIVLGTNGTQQNIVPGCQLRHVTAVLLTEYMIKSTAPGSGVWKLDLGSDVRGEANDNVIGEGFVVHHSSDTYTHVVYDTPRVVCQRPIAQINNLLVTLNRLATLAPATIETATFTSATFHLTFVCQDPDWTPDLTLAQSIREPLRAQARFSTRTPWF